ncbi:MAG: hypothetical protein OHK93_003124 [Ramalina farinacea]|uniref:Uncharacterized protein n=1 Tax=Ramalina farinacea TaxID=258253 RepID=A0AA43TXU5_9LECA|nr:hypothetical protein [Ramalina farinacea]
MSSRPFRPLLADLQAFSTNFHLSTAPPPPLDATLPLFPEPKKTTTATTAPGPATRPPNTGTSAPPEQLPTPRTLSRTLSPLEPLDEPLQPPPRLLPWFARNEPKPDISRPYPPYGTLPSRPEWEAIYGSGSTLPSIGPPASPPTTTRGGMRGMSGLSWQQQWECVYGPWSTAPEIGPPASPPPPTRMRGDRAGMTTTMGSIGEMTWQQQWHAIYGPNTPLPTVFPPGDPRQEGEAWLTRPSALQPEIVARVSPLQAKASAEAAAMAAGSTEATGLKTGRKRANVVSDGSEYMARVEAIRSQVGEQHRHGPPARNSERAARLARQRTEERRERVRRDVGGLRIPGHDYGDGGEEGARERERREGVWVGPVVEERQGGVGDGEMGVRLRGGGCAMSLSRRVGKGREGRSVAMDEREGQGGGEGGVDGGEGGEGALEGEEGGEGAQAGDEGAEEELGSDEEEEEEVEWSEEEVGEAEEEFGSDEEEEEVQWSEVGEDDDHLSSFDTAFPEAPTSLSPSPAPSDDSDADFESDRDDEEESSPFKEDRIWDGELERWIILVSSSFTTRDEGALVEVTEIHLEGEEVEAAA